MVPHFQPIISIVIGVVRGVSLHLLLQVLVFFLVLENLVISCIAIEFSAISEEDNAPTDTTSTNATIKIHV